MFTLPREAGEFGISPAAAEDRRRQIKEARAAGALHQPGIRPACEFGEADGRILITMACLEGRTLRQPSMTHVAIEPIWDGLRGDPRWQELLRLINYPTPG